MANEYKEKQPSIRLSSSFQRKRAIFKEIYYFSKCANSAYPTNFKPNYHGIFLEEEFSSRIITLYLPILFTELVRKCDTYLADDLTNSQSSTTSTMLEVIKLIESNYRTITLTSAADTLGYNKNYLSNFIKNTNFTFTELVNKQKCLQQIF